MNMQKILFYKPSDAYGDLSNFSNHPIIVNNKEWPTVEHFFQSQKFVNTPYEEQIRHLETPMEARNYGRDRSKPIRNDWESVKDQIMFIAVHQKFFQYPELTKLLISTGDAYLVEHTKNDNYWGDGGHGRGRNMLGQILMQVRDQLKQANIRS